MGEQFEATQSNREDERQSLREEIEKAVERSRDLRRRSQSLREGGRSDSGGDRRNDSDRG